MESSRLAIRHRDRWLVLTGCMSERYGKAARHGSSQARVSGILYCPVKSVKHFPFAVSDLNHDGRDDLIVGLYRKIGPDGRYIAGSHARVASQYATHTGGFYWAWGMNIAATPSGVIVSDLNRDGRVDLVINIPPAFSQGPGAEALLLPGKWGGTFGLLQSLAENDCQVRPLFRGGLPDLFCARSSNSNSQNNILLLINQTK